MTTSNTAIMERSADDTTVTRPTLESLPTEIRLMILEYVLEAEIPSRTLVRINEHDCACSSKPKWAAAMDDSPADNMPSKINYNLGRFIQKLLCSFNYCACRCRCPCPLMHTSSRRRGINTSILLVNQALFLESRDVLFTLNTLTLTSKETFSLLDQPDLHSLITNVRIIEHHPADTAWSKNITHNFRRLEQILSAPRLKTVEMGILPLVTDHIADSDGDDISKHSHPHDEHVHVNWSSVHIALWRLGLEHAVTLSCDEIGLYSIQPATRGRRRKTPIPTHQLSKLHLVHHEIRQACLEVSNITDSPTLKMRAHEYFPFRALFGWINGSIGEELRTSLRCVYERSERKEAECTYIRNALFALLCLLRLAQAESMLQGPEAWEECRREVVEDVLEFHEWEGSEEEGFDLDGMTWEEESVERHEWTEICAVILQDVIMDAVHIDQSEHTNW